MGLNINIKFKQDIDVFKTDQWWSFSHLYQKNGEVIIKLFKMSQPGFQNAEVNLKTISKFIDDGICEVIK